MNESDTSTISSSSPRTTFDRLATLSVIWLVVTPVAVIAIFIFGEIGVSFLLKHSLLNPWLIYLGVDDACLSADAPLCMFIGEAIAFILGIASLCGKQSRASSFGKALGTIVLSGMIAGLLFVFLMVGIGALLVPVL